MDYKKSSLLLKKITSLYTTLHENEAHASSMEKQLMQSYLTDFFDAFVSGDGDTDLFHQSAAAEAVKPASAVNQSPVKVVATPEIITPITTIQESQNEIAQTIEQVNTNQPKPQEAQIDALPVNQPEVILEPAKVPTVTESTPEVLAVESKSPEAITDKEMIVNAKDIIKQNITNSVDSDLLALFEDNPVTDLSDKLSMLPISDLTKAFSINEKFFTIQQLFGGDSQVFEQTLSKLNGLSSFDEASSELIESVASQFEWAAETKKKKAGQFIKLVKRRYQA